MITQKIELNPKYSTLGDDSRYYVITGGRASGKSFSVNLMLVLLTYEANHTILFTRYTLTSAYVSIIPEFIEKIEMLNKFDDFHITKDEIINIYHHIGIYLYKVSILEKFVNLKQTKNEIKNQLEQLRAIDNNIKINVALAKSSYIGIDTQEDYLALKKIMEYKS